MIENRDNPGNETEGMLNKSNSKMPEIISLMFITGYFAIFILCMLKPEIAEKQTTMFYLFYATINLGIGSILGYWFGSSASSKQKDQAIVENIQDARAKEKTETEKAKMILDTANTVAQTAQTNAETTKDSVKIAQASVESIKAASTLAQSITEDKK